MQPSVALYFRAVCSSQKEEGSETCDKSENANKFVQTLHFKRKEIYTLKEFGLPK